MNELFHTRRAFLGGLTLGALALAAPGAYADELMRTPAQTEGPFYPDKLPLDTDNDLLIVNDSMSQAMGKVTHLSGRILDARGEPIRNAVVEIWQCDNNGVYLHSADKHAQRDASFQGYGRFLTGSTGEYYFRTIKPIPYPGRTPHIHFAINRHKKPELITQCYIKGHPQNESDGVFKGIDLSLRKAVLVDWNPLKNSRIGELQAKFDVVMGYTPTA
jgi:protocatechuate 3,4-dioxygenase beta subunit